MLKQFFTNGSLIFIYLCLFILGHHVLYSQNDGYRIEGYVINESTGDPIAYANIYNFET